MRSAVRATGPPVATAAHTPAARRALRPRCGRTRIAATAIATPVTAYAGEASTSGPNQCAVSFTAASNTLAQATDPKTVIERHVSQRVVVALRVTRCASPGRTNAPTAATTSAATTTSLPENTAATRGIAKAVRACSTHATPNSHTVESAVAVYAA